MYAFPLVENCRSVTVLSVLDCLISFGLGLRGNQSNS
jgi:hypothetical protein